MWPQLQIKHLLLLTGYVALVSALIPIGPSGWSVIPVTMVIPMFWLGQFVSASNRCPELLKFRYHVGVLTFNWSLFFTTGILMIDFGWWRFPFNAILSVYILPAKLLMIQMIKHSDAAAPNVQLRVTQISLVWICLLLNLGARFAG